jgi:GT2 family glycosyltransferase
MGLFCDTPLKIMIVPSDDESEDYGPASKLLSTLPLVRDMDACIITIDDDIVYDRRMIQELTSRAPHHGALGFSCDEMPSELPLVRAFSPSSVYFYGISAYTAWHYPFNDVVECKGWLMGYQGILYRRRSFGIDAFTAPDEGMCFYTDDIRLSGYLHKHGIKRYVHPHFTHPDGEETYTILEKAELSLSSVPNTVRDRQWPCAKHYFA